jgi:Uncharacterised nucleotidyltransferase
MNMSALINDRSRKGAQVVIRRREDELLLRCVRSHIDPPEADRLESLASQEIDWEYVIQAALAHRVLPLLYHSLHNSCPNAVPNLIMRQLRELYQSNARRNLFLSRELLTLLKLLESHGIGAIAFKGPVLSVYAYGSLSLRQYIDLDILVRKKDILRAKDLILSKGYRLWQEMTEKEQLSHLECKHAFVFVPNSRMYSLDLHWTVTRRHYSYSLSDEILWDDVESLCFGGNKVLTFRLEKMILVLTAHGSKHSWLQLGWICDVAQLVRSRPDLNWQEVMREASETRCLKGLLLALQLANSLLGTALPNSVLQIANTYPGVTAAARRVTRQLFCAEQPLLLRRFRRLVFLVRLKQRVKDGLMFLSYELKAAMTPTSKDYALVSLPVFLSFLHYVIRPIRLTVSYGLLPLIRCWPHSASSDYSWSEEKLRHSADRGAGVEEKRDTNE